MSNKVLKKAKHLPKNTYLCNCFRGYMTFVWTSQDTAKTSAITKKTHFNTRQSLLFQSSDVPMYRSGMVGCKSNFGITGWSVIDCCWTASLEQPISPHTWYRFLEFRRWLKTYLFCSVLQRLLMATLTAPYWAVLTLHSNSTDDKQVFALIICSTVVLQCYRRQSVPMEQGKIRSSVTCTRSSIINK